MLRILQFPKFEHDCLSLRSRMRPAVPTIYATYGWHGVQWFCTRIWAIAASSPKLHSWAGDILKWGLGSVRTMLSAILVCRRYRTNYFHRATLPLAVAFAITFVPAVLYPSRRTSPLARAEEPTQTSAEADAPEGDAGTASFDDAALVNTMCDIPEEARCAAAELARAGVKSVIGKYHVDEGDGEIDDDEVEGEVFGELSCVRFHTSGTASQPGFQIPFTGKALGQLLRNLRDLDCIDLSGTNVTNDHLNELKEVPNLACLILSHTPIDDAGAAHLRSLRRLWQLEIDGTRITDAGLKKLAGLRALRRLSLADTNVSDAGLTHLRGLPLRRICLARTMITDAGLRSFKDGMTDLRSLDLTDTKVTKAGIDQLFRDVPSLRDRNDGNIARTRVHWGSTMANNPPTVEAATPEQVARLKDVLWWLPEDTELLEVTHGPFRFGSLKQSLDDTLSTESFFNWSIRPGIDLLNLDTSTLEDLTVAMVVKGGRHFHFRPTAPMGEWSSETCHIILFDRPLGSAGESLRAAIAKRAGKMEMIGRTKVAQIESDTGDFHWTFFIAQPAPNVLLVGNNRGYMAEMLARMGTKAARRAFAEDRREWNHLDTSARQWAIRYFAHPPDRYPEWPFVGMVYFVQGGDLAKITYLSAKDTTAQIARQFVRLPDVEISIRELNIIEVSVRVGKKQAIVDFFTTLFEHLSM